MISSCLLFLIILCQTFNFISSENDKFITGEMEGKSFKFYPDNIIPKKIYQTYFTHRLPKDVRVYAK